MYFIEILKLKLYSDLVFLATCDSDFDPSHWLQVSSQVQVPISKSQVKSQVQNVQVSSQVLSRKITDSSRLESQITDSSPSYSSAIQQRSVPPCRTHSRG